MSVLNHLLERLTNIQQFQWPVWQISYNTELVALSPIWFFTFPWVAPQGQIWRQSKGLETRTAVGCRVLQTNIVRADPSAKFDYSTVKIRIFSTAGASPIIFMTQYPATCRETCGHPWSTGRRSWLFEGDGDRSIRPPGVLATGLQRDRASSLSGAIEIQYAR